jgi:type I restriction enzyme S subunit
MELMEGFKQTELGLICSDWTIVEFQEVMEGFSSGQTPYRGNPEFFRGDIPWITSGELNYNIVVDTKEKITPEGMKDANLKKIPKGTFLMAITGLEAAGTRGSCAITGIDATTNQSCMALYPKKDKLLTQYLFHFYVRYGNELAFKYCQGTKQQSYTAGLAKRLPIILPPSLPEQNAIATALSDMDALIAHTEKLIEKKKAIKQGMMQQLLSPYDAEGKLKDGWQEKTLFELADSKKELFDDGDWIESEHITTLGVRLIQTGNIGIGRFVEKEEKKYIFESSFKKLRCKALNKDDILICRLAEPAGRACLLPDIGDEKIVTSVDVTIFRPRKEVANRIFLINLFSTLPWFSKIAERVGGTTHKRISRNSLGKIRILIPSIEVQNKIAELLSAIDKELIQLEIKSGKLQSLKQAMMQTLLTGKIRIYKPEHEPTTKV